jgi:hypothetical protein
MLDIRLSHRMPWDIATTTSNGRVFTEQSRASAICQLARALVAAGIPDQPWLAYAANGTLSMRGPSIHRMAELTIKDSPLRWVKYHPQDSPEASPEASEASPLPDTGEEEETARRAPSAAARASAKVDANAT